MDKKPPSIGNFTKALKINKLSTKAKQRRIDGIQRRGFYIDQILYDTILLQSGDLLSETIK